MNGLYWHQFLKFEKIDAGTVFRGVDSFEYLKKNFEIYLTKFPGLINKIPIESGKYQALNVTAVYRNAQNGTGTWTASEYLTPSLPNGIYRHTIKLYNEEDPIGFMIYWHLQRYDAMGDDRI